MTTATQTNGTSVRSTLRDNPPSGTAVDPEFFDSVVPKSLEPDDIQGFRFTGVESNSADNSIKPAERTSYSLSDELRQRGEELTELEAVVLDAAQTLHRQFKNGKAVSFRAVQRVALRYHFDVVQGVKLRKVANRLQSRGLCKIGYQMFRLMRHSGPERNHANPSGFTRLTADPTQIQLLQACENCCGQGFRRRNVAARAAVKSLIQAPFNLTNAEFNRLVRELIAAGIIEEIPSKGTTAFRLTPAARLVVEGDATTLEDAAVQLSDSDRPNEIATQWVQEPFCIGMS